MTKNQARAAGLNSTVTARVSVGTSACFCVIVFQGLNENPQCSIRPAQERTLATTAWLAPHGRFVVELLPSEVANFPNCVPPVLT